MKSRKIYQTTLHDLHDMDPAILRISQSRVSHASSLLPRLGICASSRRVSALWQTTLRAVLSPQELDEMLSDRKKLRIDVRSIVEASRCESDRRITNFSLNSIEPRISKC